jgi:DNA-binding response OmpR family regulator
MKVLVVDDDEDLRDSLAELFADEGYEVLTAGNGEVALHLLDTIELPCIVILDLMMPVLDGNQVYERMQNDPRLAKVPVIISTSDPSRAPSGLLIMKKPINLDRLLAAVKHLCGNS